MKTNLTNYLFINNCDAALIIQAPNFEYANDFLDAYDYKNSYDDNDNYYYSNHTIPAKELNALWNSHAEFRPYTETHIRSPRFDTKRTLIHQLAINNPDLTVQQMADAVSHLTPKEPCNLDCLNCDQFYRPTYCKAE